MVLFSPKKISNIIVLAMLFTSGCSIRPLYERANVENSRNIDVDVIADREGQKLRSYLLDTFRDIKFSHKKYILSIKLSNSEKQFAFTSDGNASRKLLSYVAEITLKNEDRKPLLQKTITVSMAYNVSHAQGSVTLSLYGMNNDSIIKELGDRIVEYIRMFIESEN